MTPNALTSTPGAAPIGATGPTGPTGPAPTAGATGATAGLGATTATTTPGVAATTGTLGGSALTGTPSTTSGFSAGQAGGTSAGGKATGSYQMGDYSGMIDRLRNSGQEAQAWGLYNSLSHAGVGGFAGGAQGAISASMGAPGAREWVNNMYTKYGESGVDLATGQFKGMGQGASITGGIEGWDPSRFNKDIAMTGGGWNPEAAARAQAAGTYEAPTAGWEDTKWGGYKGALGADFQGKTGAYQGPQFAGQAAPGTVTAPGQQSQPQGAQNMPPPLQPTQALGGGLLGGMAKPAMQDDLQARQYDQARVSAMQQQDMAQGMPGSNAQARGMGMPVGDNAWAQSQPMQNRDMQITQYGQGSPGPANMYSQQGMGSQMAPQGQAGPFQQQPMSQRQPMQGQMGPQMGPGQDPYGPWGPQMGPNGGSQGQGGGSQDANSYWRTVSQGPIQNDIQGQPYYNDASQKAYMQQAQRTLDPQWQQNTADQEAQLTNMGLSRGSEAWNREAANLARNKNDAYQSATNASILNAGAEGTRMQGMDLAQGQFHNQAQNQDWTQRMGNQTMDMQGRQQWDQTALGNRNAATNEYQAWSGNQLGNRAQDTSAFQAYNNASLGNRGVTMQEQQQNFNNAQQMQRFPYELQNLAMGYGQGPQSPQFNTPGTPGASTPTGAPYAGMQNSGIGNQYGGMATMGGAAIGAIPQWYNQGGTGSYIDPATGQRYTPGQG